MPPFNFFDEDARIFTRARFLPASKINSCVINRATLADGCIVTDAKINHSTLGVRSVVRDQSLLENVVMMGADNFETLEDLKENKVLQRPDYGVGQNCIVKNAILDKNVRIGNNVVLDPTGLPDNFGSDVDVAIRDGVLVVCKDTIVPDGFMLKA